MMRQRGFTLLELIVVIGIFGVMSLMAYGGLDSVLRTRTKVEAALTRTADFQKAYRRLRDDLQQVRLRPVRDGFGDVQPPLEGPAREGPLAFTRGGWRNPLQLPRPGLERVRYRLDERRLLRESWRVLDQAQDSPVVALVLLDKVEELRWRFLDPTREWRERWPPEGAAAQTPLLVELTLRTPDWGEIRWLFRPGVDVAAGAFTTPLVLGDDSADGNPPVTEPAP